MQNIAQLAAVADAESRRKISEISSEEKPIYGIAATTYWNWQCLVLKDILRVVFVVSKTQTRMMWWRASSFIYWEYCFDSEYRQRFYNVIPCRIPTSAAPLEHTTDLWYYSVMCGRCSVACHRFAPDDCPTTTDEVAKALSPHAGQQDLIDLVTKLKMKNLSSGLMD